MNNSRPRIAVIGSGFGGLALAIRLQAQGCDVTIFEKRKLPGGRAYVYHQDGFTFDAGPTVVTAPQVRSRRWNTTNRPMITPLQRIVRLA